MTILLILGVVALIIYSIAGFDLMIGNRSVRFLRDVAPQPSVSPRVSIIVAARNEARNIREAMLSLLDLNYPDYEIVVVDDRSDDRTGPILDNLTAIMPRLRVIHVDELPSGWLGKNHALWVGSQRATGDLLLFTDADIVMESTVLARAVSLLESSHLDHLALTPSMRMPSLFLEMFGTSFILFFSLFVRPWKARDPTSRCHIGIGAFNLVRTSVYRSVGGHRAIRMRPDDDIKLGKIIKQGGFRQDVAFGPEFLKVEWYASLRDLVQGLEKNAFSGADYSVVLILAGSLFHALCSVWPYVAVLFTSGVTRGIYAAVVCLITLLYIDSARFHRAKSWHAFGFPLTAALFVFILLRTMMLNLIQGGIRWRGTFYPLKDLKGNKV